MFAQRTPLITINHVDHKNFQLVTEKLIVYFNLIDTKLGTLQVAWTSLGICNIDLSKDSINFYKTLETEWPFSEKKYSPVEFSVRQTILTLLSSSQNLNQNDNSKQIATSAMVKATEFQLKVWRALLEIPSGYLCSYSHIGAMINSPNSTRAVGNALAKNPLALLIPCHRVIRSNGKLGNYKWGKELKIKLITLEFAKELQKNILRFSK